MKLIIAIVHDNDAEAIVNRLVAQSYRVTRIASSGGFLRKGSVTLVIGVEPERVQAVIDLLKEAAGVPEPGPHRVTLFVINALKFEQI
jgi:uncharacterized protein YaaQ